MEVNAIASRLLANLILKSKSILLLPRPFRPRISQPLINLYIPKLHGLAAFVEESDIVRRGIPRPDPSADDEAIVGVDFHNPVVHQDHEVERLDVRFCLTLALNVEQSELSNFVSCCDTVGREGGGAGVAAVDDEGFVAEF